MSKANPRYRRNNALLPLLTTPAYRVTSLYLVDGQICLISQDFIMTTSSQTAASEQNITTSFNLTTLTLLRACLANDCFQTAVRTQCLTTPSRIPWTTFFASGSQAGSGGSTHLPSEIAVILSKATSTKGQHGRGRLFLPGIPSAFLAPATDANRLTAAALTTVSALATAILSAGTVDGANVGIASITQSTKAGAPTIRGQALSLITVRLLVGVIRRRRIGRGK